MKRIIVLFLTVTVLLSSGILSVFAVEPGQITLSVGDVEARPGESRVSVNVGISGNTGISGFSFCVDYGENLIFINAEISIAGGYKVIKEVSGCGVNIAWTSSADYYENGTVATLYFDVAGNASPGEYAIKTVLREGYDSIYKTVNGSETDLPLKTTDGKLTVTEKPAEYSMAVSAGYTSAAVDDSDVVIPIYVENNTGFSGFGFCVNYDKTRLQFKSAEITIEDGYKVINHPSGYGAGLAWTSDSDYAADGVIAYLHFSVLRNAIEGKGYVEIEFRDGYDSFYKTVNYTEQDVECKTTAGYVDVIAIHNFGEWITVSLPSCTEPGLKKRTCTDSGCWKTEEDIIPKLGHKYGEPEWVWSENEAKAKFTCSVCDDVVTINATVTNAEDKGIINYTATAVFNEKSYTDKKSEYIEYTVKFVDYGGTVISEKTYHYGDNVTAPNDPIREEDDKYTYTFKGWDKDIIKVIADATYTAVYDIAEKYSFLPGDVNGDGRVDNKDVVTLFRYVSGNKANVNDIALDVNGDGKINNKDVTILFRHLNNSEIKISDKPYMSACKLTMIAIMPEWLKII